LNRSGGNGEKVTPVPIPNTEVKLLSADGSWGESPCESRTLPGKKSNLFIGCFFILFAEINRCCFEEVFQRLAEHKGKKCLQILKLPKRLYWKVYDPIFLDCKSTIMINKVYFL
jgi:hypothetical protein